MGKKSETVVVEADGTWNQVSYQRMYKPNRVRVQHRPDELSNPQLFDHVVFVRTDSKNFDVEAVNKGYGVKNKQRVRNNLARLDVDDVPDIQTIPRPVSEVIKKARNNAKLTQHELAVKSGILEATIKSIENLTAKWTDDTKTDARKIADYLGVGSFKH